MAPFTQLTISGIQTFHGKQSWYETFRLVHTTENITAPAACICALQKAIEKFSRAAGDNQVQTKILPRTTSAERNPAERNPRS